MQPNNNKKLIRSIMMVFVAVFTISITAAIPSSAQVDDRARGFYLGLKFIGSSLHVDDDGDNSFFVKDDGGGVQLHAGYSFNRVFSLELSLGGANHETSVQAIDANFGLVQLFAHYRFRPGRAFRPYIKGGFGGYTLELSDNKEIQAYRATRGLLVLKGTLGQLEARATQEARAVKAINAILDQLAVLAIKAIREIKATRGQELRETRV